MVRKELYKVGCWIDGASYDKGKAPDVVVEVRALSVSRAEDIADANGDERYDVLEAYRA